MKVIHRFDRTKVEKKVRKNVYFILNNKKGSYLYMGDEPTSRYQGFSIFDGGKLYRTIENISIGKGKVSELQNNYTNVRRKRTKTEEQFFFPLNKDSFIYRLDSEKKFTITFDCKEAYDNRVWGRNYRVHKEHGCIVVSFTKYTDQREDGSHGVQEYELFTAIKSDTENFRQENEWVKRQYELDMERGSEPYERYVFKAITLKSKKIVACSSTDKKKAVTECIEVYENEKKLEEERKKHIQEIVNKSVFKNIKDKELKLAYLSTLNSLDSLSTKKGILAGVPWFYQVWPRDELISVKGLMLMKKYDESMDILKRELKAVDDKGMLPNNFNEGFVSADAIGWLFVQLSQLNKKMSIQKLASISSIKKICDETIMHNSSDGFAFNNSKETWMDSIERSGVRIEIQALRLAILDLTYKLTRDYKYLRMKQNLRKKIYEHLFHGSYLGDGINDNTKRPNIFIAHYVYSGMLTKEEWKTCFSSVIHSLFLKYGGLSTIDTKNPSFVKEHTGENSQSYHNGDSWYWINNLAALTMQKLDPKLYKKNINKIKNASTSEILWNGAIGHHSEISSASRLESRGCFQQAWSNAMFIELVNELN